MQTRGRSGCAAGRCALVQACAAALIVLLSTAPCRAAECGDSVNARRVPCRCGDSVVVDTVLRAQDPVVLERCHGDGLIVDARSMAETIVLDLAGLTLRGVGVGVGIDVLAGGSDGAAIAGGRNGRRGQVVGFGVGLRVRKPRAARRIESLLLLGNWQDGMELRSSGTMVFDVEARRNGGDGFRVSGQGGRLLGVLAVENGRSGIRLYTRETVLQGAAIGNRRHGIIANGARNDLRQVTARDNDGYGVVLAGPGHQRDIVDATGNVLANVVRQRH